MTEQQLKDEIKRLRDKLYKKNIRVRELIAKLKNASEMREQWFTRYMSVNDELWVISKNFPNKYYRVTWSGINVMGQRNPLVTELKLGVCAKAVIADLENRHTDVKIEMIEEVAT